MTPFFRKGRDFGTKFDPLNDVLYVIFDWFQLLNKNMFNVTLNIRLLLILVGDVYKP